MMTKKLNFSQDNFLEVEDHVVSKICHDCTHVFDELDEQDDVCPNCEGELLNNTRFEDTACYMCKNNFDMWAEEVYEHASDSSVLICNDCLDTLPENDSDIIKEVGEHEQVTPKPYMVSPSELEGKTIDSVYQAKWNGSTVIECTDGAICVTYSSYDYRNGVTEFGYLNSVEDYERLILNRN